MIITDNQALTHLAEHLSNQGVGTWSPDSPYPAGTTGIYLGAIPETATTGIGLIRYGTSRDDLATGRLVQALVRAPTRAAAYDLADALFTACHYTHLIPLIAQAKRLSVADLGDDPSGYTITTNLQLTYRTI